MSLKGFYMSPADFEELEHVEGDLIRLRSLAKFYVPIPVIDPLFPVIQRLQKVLNRSSCRVRDAEIKRRKRKK